MSSETNSMLHNLWSFREIIGLFKDKAREYGIKVIAVSEMNTSITCPVCAYRSRKNRPKRGLFVCRKCSFVGNADVVGALNMPPIRVNPASWRDSPNGLVARPRSLH